MSNHWLIVPEAAGEAMSLEHATICTRMPARLHDGTAWKMGSVPVCPEAQLVKEFGLEHFFHRAGSPPDGYENPVRITLEPGLYACGLEADPEDATLSLNRLTVF